MTSALTFSFQHALLSALVEVREDLLVGKMSTRTVVVPLKELRAFYAPRAPYAPHQELVLAYMERGRLRRARLFADVGAVGFEGLVSYLRARSPELDISHLAAQEAYRALGCSDRPWVTVPLLMLGGALLLAALAAPLLIHGLDRGEDLLEPAALTLSAEGFSARLTALRSRNLRLEGAALDLGRAALLEEQGRSSLLAPITPVDASSGPSPLPAAAPTLAIALWSGRALDLEELGGRRALRGVWRGVGWEGLSAPQLARLRAAGVTPSAPHLLLELDADPADDLAVYLSLLCAALGVTVFVWRSLSARRPLALSPSHTQETPR